MQEFLGQFRRSVSGAKKVLNRGRCWCRSTWDSSGGQYKGQRKGRTEAGAVIGVPVTVQKVSIRGRVGAEQRQELVPECLGQFRRSVYGAEDGQHKGRS